MHATRIVLALALGVFAVGFAARSPLAAPEQEAKRQSGKSAELEALNASYQAQLRAVESRWIADLAVWADKAHGTESDAAYQQLFNLALARSLCPEAQAAAARCLAEGSRGRDVRALAILVQAVARAEKGEHDQALADLKALLHKPASGTSPAGTIDAETALAVGEAYLQRLIRDGRYDVAHELCELACHDDAPAMVKDHFGARMARLDLLGKPAPPITGTDVDGQPVSLADLKGKVVLVDFWATWCPPCVASIPALNALAQKYHDRGFVILGVNVDPMHEDVKEIKTALSVVRRFLVKHRVTWTNLLNGQGTGDFAAAYGVKQIPANFLVGRDGKVIALEQSGEMLDRAVGQALGGAENRHAK